MDNIQPKTDKEFKLEDYQDQFLWSEAKFPAMTAGWGTGKSMLGIMRGMILSERYPGNVGTIFRKEYTDLRDCFDDKTEILTDKGFLFFKELQGDEEVLSINPKTEKADYYPIKRLIIQQYDGDLYYVDKKEVSMAVTPNHRLLIQTETSKDHKKAYSNWKLKKIQDIKVARFGLKRDCVWAGREANTIELTPSTNGRNAKKYTFRMDDWLELLGWYVSEGTTYKHRTKKTWWVSISQSRRVNPEKCAKIENLLARMGLSTTQYSGDKYVIGSRAIGEHLAQKCGCYSDIKRVPDYIKDFSPRQIRIFLEAYRCGDGYAFHGENRYNTVSKQLADDIQELVLKAGGYARISVRNNIGKKSYIKDHMATTRHLDYLIIEQSKWKTQNCGVSTKDIKKKKYIGKIYCIETEPYHTIYVRKNGACFWSGNSTMSDFETYTGIRVNQQRKDAVLRNTSKVLFRHIEDINNLQNINLGWFMIDQGEELESDEQWFYLYGRLRRADAEFRSGWVVSNAKGHNWIWELWENKPPSEQYHFVSATTYENEKNLPDDFIKSLEDIKDKRPSIYNRCVLNSRDEGEIEDYIVTSAMIEAVVGARPNAEPVDKIYISCDPARFGDDETVIYVFKNYSIIYKEYLRGKDTMEIAGKLAIIAGESNAGMIVVDEIGVGGGVVDRVRQLLKDEIDRNEIVIIAHNGAQKCDSEEDKAQYMNKRAWAWCKTADLISECKITIPKNEETLIKQLKSVKYSFVKGKYRIERKEDVKKRLTTSPDRADAFMQGPCYINECPYAEAYMADAENQVQYQYREAGY